MTTTQTTTSASGLIRTDILRDGSRIGFVGHLPDNGGFLAFTDSDKRLGAYTDFRDAQYAIEQRA